MEYSAVSHPPVTLCSFIHRGTDSSIIAEQITRVSPQATSTDPVELGAKPGVKVIVRSCPASRPLCRIMMRGTLVRAVAERQGPLSSDPNPCPILRIKRTFLENRPTEA